MSIGVAIEKELKDARQFLWRRNPLMHLLRLLEEQRQQLSAVSSERENEVARRTLELSKVVEEREQRLIARRSLTSPEQKDLDELDEKYFIIHKNTN